MVMVVNDIRVLLMLLVMSIMTSIQVIHSNLNSF